MVVFMSRSIHYLGESERVLNGFEMRNKTFSLNVNGILKYSTIAYSILREVLRVWLAISQYCGLPLAVHCEHRALNACFAFCHCILALYACRRLIMCYNSTLLSLYLVSCTTRLKATPAVS